MRPHRERRQPEATFGRCSKREGWCHCRNNDKKHPQYIYARNSNRLSTLLHVHVLFYTRTKEMHSAAACCWNFLQYHFLNGSTPVVKYFFSFKTKMTFFYYTQYSCKICSNKTFSCFFTGTYLHISMFCLCCMCLNIIIKYLSMFVTAKAIIPKC